ncbi:MAG TPA: hypothetical protein VIJ36_16425 [Thermoanaerobaculia bacterium]|jgi:hypothetical protein
MPSNLLLFLPLLGGYLFIHFCHRFYFRAQALDGYRLIFEATVAGFTLFLPCRVVVYLLGQGWPELRALWYGAGGHVPLLSSLALTLPAAPLAAYIWNLCEGLRALPTSRDEENDEWAFLEASREKALSWAVKRWGNTLQNLLHEAAKRANDKDPALVCLTMKDRKAFVGWIAKSPNLRANDAYVSVIPVMSGYRHKDTLDLNFSVFYPVESYFEEDGRLSADEFLTALPVAEITSARFFDLDLYFEKFAPSEDEPVSDQGTNGLAGAPAGRAAASPS